MKHKQKQTHPYPFLEYKKIHRVLEQRHKSKKEEKNHLVLPIFLKTLQVTAYTYKNLNIQYWILLKTSKNWILVQFLNGKGIRIQLCLVVKYSNPTQAKKSAD